jgi:glucosylceramidase
MIKVIQTSIESKLKWQVFHVNYDMNLDTSLLPIISIDPQKRYQSVIGFGGAFTEAACYTIMHTPVSIRQKIIDMYFSEKGLCYNLGRISIHSCDFSLESYTYINEVDKNLNNFDISRENQYVIPILKEAKKVAKNGLSLLASPWSPPSFMKTNQSMLNGGSLLPEYRQMWADYIVKYLLEMKRRDISVDLLTIQNEPEAVQIWESCIMSAQEEAEFITDYLYPSLLKANIEHTKLLIWDHNRDRIIDRAKVTFANSQAFKLAWGIGYHWYVSDAHENLTALHNLFPTKHILFTEGCVELANGALKEHHQPSSSWEHGERYGRNIINDFNNFNEGWIDWNLVLNEIGGPNHVKNYCEAPLMYDRNNHKLIVNPSYYYIGHFARYIQPGAYRIYCQVDKNITSIATSFINPNGEIIIVIQNEKEKKEIVLKVSNRYTKLTLPSRSITTIVVLNKQKEKKL